MGKVSFVPVIYDSAPHVDSPETIWPFKPRMSNFQTSSASLNDMATFYRVSLGQIEVCMDKEIDYMTEIQLDHIPSSRCDPGMVDYSAI